MSSFSGKVALVTGGARVIGRAIVESFADAGATVAFTYKSSVDAAQQVISELSRRGISVRAYQSDAASFPDTVKIVETLLRDCGRLDILVNNAGVTKDGLLMRMTEDDWDTVISNNLKSVFNFSKAASRPMISQRSGKIINISSIAGMVGNAGQTNYASSKAGMIGFTKSLAKELGSRNIQINAVAPGFVDTDMTGKLTADQKKTLTEGIPLKRTAHAHEIASVVRFLASSEADYITGQVICVDGGLTM